MDSPQNSRWTYFMDDNFVEEGTNASNAFFWYEQPTCIQACSVENNNSKSNLDDLDKQGSRKRSRDELSNTAPSKACREKIRRDKLNDRFMELSAVLEPGKKPKSDKASILVDAFKVVTQLRSEVEQLKESNHQLKESIKELKVEKSELRDEKLRLKLEKETLEQQTKGMIISSGYIPHPAAVHAPVAAIAAQNQANGNKVSSVVRLPAGTTMWQYMPIRAVDTSQDHVLRPPVA